MSRSLLPISVICAANIVPLIVGLVFYPKFIGVLSSNYILFTIVFWSIAVILFALFNRKALHIAISNLRNDVSNPNAATVARFIILILILLVLINIDWVAGSRDLGIDVRGVRFKIFFLFEDMFFIIIVYYFCKVLIFPRFGNVLTFLCISTGMVMVFGRFGLVAGPMIGLVIFGSKGLFQGVGRKVGMAMLLFGVVTGVYVIENARAKNLPGSQLSISDVTLKFVDRLGEFGTLKITDQVFERSEFAGLSNFSNLQYLYLPSVLFPDKPIIEGGSTYLSENFGLGSANELYGTGTRFPIMLHVDSYRRFGWWGLGFAILPGGLFLMSLSVFQWLRTKLKIPFIEIISIKYAIFIYPKSVIGLIELFFYTTLRSALVLYAIILVMRSLTRAPTKHVATL
jgi:hypothetical protein